MQARAASGSAAVAQVSSRGNGLGRRCSALIGAALAAGSTTAAERSEGSFVAMKSCEAFQSKNRGTNPGDIRTEPLRAYPIMR